MLDYYNKFGKIPSVLSFSFAALINFYEDFENKDYPVNDVESVLYFFKAKHNDIVFDVLANIGFWGEDLTKIDGLYKKVKLLDDIPFGHKVLLNDLKKAKILSNTAILSVIWQLIVKKESIAKRKSNWIDFNAGELIESNDFENMTEEIFKLLIDIASGRQTKNEQNGYRDISIFKDGVIM